jgi:hypothetical protein
MSVRRIGEGGSVPIRRSWRNSSISRRSNKGIGGRWFITEHTVEKHVKNIFATLRLPESADDHRRVLAVVTFLNSR